MTATEETADLPWHLTGNRAPVFDERTVTDLEVTGAIPPELTGRYFRNGANPKIGRSEHWFLGDGMVHGIEFGGGNANWYRNRYVQTPMLGLADSERMEHYLDPETFKFNYDVSTANTHVLGHNGRIFALEEGAFPYELSKEIDTIGPCDFDGKLTTAMTAHPKICPETGEMLAFAYSSMPPFLTYHRVDASGNLVQSTEITVTASTMMHDFAVSRHHTVFMDLPMVFDMELAMQGGMPIRWSDDYPARFGVVPREGVDADVQWFDVDPCYVFHTLNAHDDGDEVVVRGCRIKEIWRTTTDIGGAMDDPAGLPMMWEWRFNRATGAVSERQLDDRFSDFPRVPDALAGLDGRYGYTASDSPKAGGHIFKYDFANSAERASHNFPDGHRPGEPVFVPAQAAVNEDDGYLMTFVHAEDSDTSYLAILDASDMAAQPVAQIHLPFRVPVGFHGSWIADD